MGQGRIGEPAQITALVVVGLHRHQIVDTSHDRIRHHHRCGIVEIRLYVDIYRLNALGFATGFTLHHHVVGTLFERVEEILGMPGGPAVDTVEQMQGSIGIDADIGHIFDAGEMAVGINLIRLERFRYRMNGNRIVVAAGMVVYMAIAVFGNNYIINILVGGIIDVQGVGSTADIAVEAVADAEPFVGQGTGIGYVVDGSVSHQGNGLAFANAIHQRTQGYRQGIGCVDVQHHGVAHDNTVGIAVGLDRFVGIGNGKDNRVVARHGIGYVERGAGIGNKDAAVVGGQGRFDAPAQVVVAYHAATRYQTGELSHLIGTNRSRAIQFYLAYAGIAYNHHYPALGTAGNAVGGFHIEDGGFKERSGKGMCRVLVKNLVGRRPAVNNRAGAVHQLGVQRRSITVSDGRVGPCRQGRLRVEMNRKRIGNLQTVDASVAAVQNTDHLVSVGYRVTATVVIAVVFENSAAVLLPGHFVAGRDVHAVNRAQNGIVGTEVGLTHNLDAGQIACRNIHVQFNVGRNHGRTERQRAVGSLDYATEYRCAGADIGAYIANPQFTAQAVLAHRIARSGGQIGPIGTVIGGNLPSVLVGLRLEAINVHTHHRAVALANHGRNTHAGQRRTIVNIHEYRIGFGSTAYAVVGGQIVSAGAVGHRGGMERVGTFDNTATRPVVSHYRIGIGHHLTVQGHTASLVNHRIGPGFHHGNRQYVYGNRIGIERIGIEAYGFVIGVHTGVNAVSGIGTQAQVIAGSVELAVHEPVDRIAAAIDHVCREDNFAVRTNGGFYLDIRGKGDVQGLVFLEREGYPMRNGRFGLIVDNADIVGDIGFRMRVVADMYAVERIDIACGSGSHRLAVQIPVVAEHACIHTGRQIMRRGGQGKGIAVAFVGAVANQGKVHRFVNIDRRNREAVANAYSIANGDAAHTQLHAVAVGHMEPFGIPETVGAYNTVVQAPNITQRARQRFKRNLVADLGGRLVHIPDVVERSSHAVGTERVVDTAACSVGRFIHYAQELVFVVLVNVEVNLVVAADNREHVSGLVSADRHIVDGVAQVVEVDGAVIEVNPVVEFGGAASFVVEADHTRQLVARGHVTHHRVGSAEIGGGQIVGVVAVRMAQYARRSVVIPMQVVMTGRNHPITGLGGKVLAGVVAVLFQFKADFIERQYGNVDSVGIRTTVAVGRTMQHQRAGRIHHTAPREGQVVARGQGIETVRAGRQRYQGILRPFHRIYRRRLGFEVIGDSHRQIVADGHVGNIGMPIVIFAMRNEEVHTVDGRATEGIGYGENQPYAVALLVFFSQHVQRMDGVGIAEHTVATGYPVRFAADSGIGIKPVIGIVIDTVVLTGIGNDGTEHDMRRIAHQFAVPGTTILAERHHAELILIGDVVADVAEVFLVVTHQRLAVAVPLQVGFLAVEAAGPAGNGGLQYHFDVAVRIRAGRIDFGTDGYMERIGGEYHQGGGIVTNRILGARQAGGNPADNVVVAAAFLRLLDIDKIQVGSIERRGIAVLVSYGYQMSVHIPMVDRIGAAVLDAGHHTVILVGANRIHMQIQFNLNLGNRNGNHRKYTRPNGIVLCVAVFGGIHKQTGLNMAAHRQIAALESYRIGNAYQDAVFVPFDIPVVAAVFKYGARFGNGGEQTGGFTHADTDRIAVDGAVRLDVDTRFARLDHHHGIDKRVLSVETAQTIILQHHFKDVRRAGSKVGTLEAGPGSLVVAGMA